MNNGTTIRELSSVGSERLPYKQRVGGSTPSAPTKASDCFGCFYIKSGEVLEWLKRHDWKSCELQKGSGGSNPPLSAE